MRWFNKLLASMSRETKETRSIITSVPAREYRSSHVPWLLNLPETSGFPHTVWGSPGASAWLNISVENVFQKGIITVKHWVIVSTMTPWIQISGEAANSLPSYNHDPLWRKTVKHCAETSNIIWTNKGENGSLAICQPTIPKSYQLINIWHRKGHQKAHQDVWEASGRLWSNSFQSWRLLWLEEQRSEGYCCT